MRLQIPLTLLFTVLFTALLISACSSQSASETDGKAMAMAKPTPVERGEYLTTIMGCHDCHTPKIFDPDCR